MMDLKTLTFEIKDSIAYVGFGKFEKKSMTTLSEETLQELRDVVTQLGVKEKKKEIKGVLFFSHKPGVFLAGVDVSLINSLKTESDAARGAEAGQTLYNMIEDLKVPTAAVIDGVCLGGGLELSLSCKRIYVSDNPKTALGLPEVMLGVLPGFGGTYRLPKKIGLPNALDMILTGRQVKAKAAFKNGLAEAILPTERMLELAPQLLMKPVPSKGGFEKTLERVATENFLTRKIIFQKAREKVLSQTKGFYPAPLKILEVLEAGTGKGRDAYLAMEAQAFGDLSQTAVSRNLQHIFFLTDNSKKLDGKDSLPKVNRGAVLGAGVMGGGIAWLMANNNQAPLMKDINKAGLELGLKQASSNFQSALKRRRMSEDEFNRKMRSITPTTSFDGFKGVDLVVEAVVENMDVKKKIFAELETQVSDTCLITTNTSSLSVSEMSGALKDSSRFAGLHFFNPVNKMPLVEIIAHPKASEKTLKALYKWALDAKKTPVIVNDGPGFLVNRILGPYLNEAAFLLESGVRMKEIDQAALNFGMPMGPCRLMDEVGLDVCEKVGKIMQDGLGARALASSLSKKLAETGSLGKKNSKGFYLYDEKGQPTGNNPVVESLLPSKSMQLDETQLQMRLFLPMINEAAYCLSDKIVDKASTVDMAMIYGIGFPPFKGGLLNYADSEGLDRIVSVMEQFSAEVSPERYKPAPLLMELMQSKRKFYDL